MILTPQAIEILDRQIVFNDLFHPGLSSWEITSKPEEQSYIRNGYYWMENKSDNHWMYYKNKMPLMPSDDFFIDTQLDLLSDRGYGYFGLCWGFDEDKEVLNRFTLSADGERCTVIHFQKDHNRVFHRFQVKTNLQLKNTTIGLSILKIQNYYYFLLNKKLVYCCDVTRFAQQGPYFGYYVEPGLFIRSPYMTVERLISKSDNEKAFDSFFL